MKAMIKELIKTILFPLFVGGLSAFLTRNAMRMFSLFIQPPLSPPAFFFPVVWTILYTLMGISLYLVKTSNADTEAIETAQATYFYQLLVNFLWPIFFFNFQWYLFSFFWLIGLWMLVLRMILQFYPISKPAAYINLPYLLWLTFAGYLNFSIWWLNK